MKLNESDHSDRTQIIAAALYFVILSFLVRFPSFFTIVIDWDESTFILMGQSLLDGYLPYIKLWDNKPPLLFLFYAGAIAAFGKSIASIRIAGALCVALTAFFTYLTGRRLWNHWAGILAATLCILIESFLHKAQAVMSEHVAILPMAVAVYLLVRYGIKHRNMFFVGMLMGIAALIRINLAYVALFVGLFIVIWISLTASKPLAGLLKSGLSYAAGGCFVLALVSLPYAAAGKFKLFWSSVILAPLSYAESQFSFWEVFRNQFVQLEPVILVWLMSSAALAGIIFSYRSGIREGLFGPILLLVCLFGTELSILNSGASFRHYLIQVIPFSVLSLTALLELLPRHMDRGILKTATFLSLVGALFLVIPDYKEVTPRLLNGRLDQGASYRIAQFLKQENPSSEPVYMMSDQIVYWLMDAQPLSKSTTHPSNIAREYLLDIIVGPGTKTVTELTRILQQNPKFIVTKENSRYLDDKISANQLLQKTLQTRYVMIKEIEGRHIYRRIQ